MLKMQKSRLTVVCLIFVVLTLKSGKTVNSCNSCHSKLHEDANNIIRLHVNFASENCEKIKDHEMTNNTGCIFKWRKVTYTQPVESQELKHLENITKLIDDSMKSTCPTQKRHKTSVCSPEKCVSRFMRCWCKFLETAP